MEGQRTNQHLSTPEPVDEAKELNLRQEVMTQLQTATSLRDLAIAKELPLSLDLRTNYPQEIRQEIINKLEKLLRLEVGKLGEEVQE